MSSPSSNNTGDDAWLMKIEMKREKLGENNEDDKIKKAAEDQVPVAEEEDILQPYYNHHRNPGHYSQIGASNMLDV